MKRIALIAMMLLLCAFWHGTGVIVNLTDNSDVILTIPSGNLIE
jgi:hypothetical protein